jgi:uncharacterized protein (TIGR02145 family)
MKKILLHIALFAVCTTSMAQVGVGTNTPDNSAVLEVQSTTKGFLPPRMTLAQIAAIASPAEGLIVYCTDCSPKTIYVYDGTNFKNLQDGAVLDTSPSTLILVQIGNEADNPDTINSVVTITQLNMITPALTSITAGNITAYQDYIDNNPNLFSSPATQAEVQSMVTAVNNAAGDSGASILAQVGNEADNPDVVNSMVTATALASIIGITGVDIAKEMAYQDYIDNNPDLFSSPATVAEVQAMIDIFNIPTITGPGGGVWMDRNLGASQAATSTTDVAAYGDLYQWGRAADGHQLRTSGTTSIQSATDTPGHGNFILNNTDWRSTANTNLWQGANGTNNPCPSGFRVPSRSEWLAEINATSGCRLIDNLKLTYTGYRLRTNGFLTNVNIAGRYWTSSVNGIGSRFILFVSSSFSTNSINERSEGSAVRCILD